MQNVFIKALVHFAEKDFYVVLLFKVFSLSDKQESSLPSIEGAKAKIKYELYVGISKFFSDFKNFSLTTSPGKVLKAILEARNKNFDSEVANYQKIYSELRNELNFRSIAPEEWSNSNGAARRAFEELLNEALPKIFRDRSFSLSLEYEYSPVDVSLEELLTDTENFEEEKEENYVPCQIILSPVKGIPLLELKKGDLLEIKLEGARREISELTGAGDKQLLLKKALVKVVSYDAENKQIHVIVDLGNGVLGRVQEEENLRVRAKRGGEAGASEAVNSGNSSLKSRENKGLSLVNSGGFSRSGALFLLALSICLGIIFFLFVYQR